MGAAAAPSESGAATVKVSRRCWRISIGVCIAIAAAPLVWAITKSVDSSNTPIYAATITAVSGLDPETDLLRQPAGTLSPVFNLTVGVASHAWWEGAHIAPGTSVKVSYSHLNLPMATGHVPDAQVAPGKSRVLPSVVASGRDVAVPGFLMDSLVEEMRSGQAMFEVELMESTDFGWHQRAQGWGRVGDTIKMYLSY